MHLGRLGDIAPLLSMSPITADVLFSPLPSKSVLATKTAPIGTALWPTWSPGAPDVVGTILGPANSSTVPSLSGLGADGLDQDDPPPAATPDQAITSGLRTGPITFVSPLPSMIKPAAGQQTPVVPSFWCGVNNWVNANPGLAALGVVGVYVFLKGKKGKR
jgi:hypothetical protein